MSSSLAFGDDKFNRVIDESEYTEKLAPSVLPPDKDKGGDEENPQDFERV
jgi:hypothetical protein